MKKDYFKNPFISNKNELHFLFIVISYMQKYHFQLLVVKHLANVSACVQYPAPGKTTTCIVSANRNLSRIPDTHLKAQVSWAEAWNSTPQALSCPPHTLCSLPARGCRRP